MPKRERELGDLDNSGVVDVLDLQRLYSYVSEIDSLTPEEEIIADMNENGKVNIVDLQALFNIVANN